MMVLKEKKEMEDNFKKAQKPWVKILTKVNKAKQDYHNACKNERSAANQERNATGDNAVSPEQVISSLFLSFSFYFSFSHSFQFRFSCLQYLIMISFNSIERLLRSNKDSNWKPMILLRIYRNCYEPTSIRLNDSSPK